MGINMNVMNSPHWARPHRPRPWAVFSIEAHCDWEESPFHPHLRLDAGRHMEARTVVCRVISRLSACVAPPTWRGRMN
jgi:hypothetical protein